MILVETLRPIVEQWRAESRNVVQELARVELGTVTVAHLYKGLRELPLIVCDTSVVDPQEGVFIRGHALRELVGRLPEEVFWLLVTGEFPTAEQLKQLQREMWHQRHVPDYVLKLIHSVPPDTHPMALLSMAILSLQKDSHFLKALYGGVPRDQLWEYMVQDAVRLMALTPTIAAGIYHHHLKGGEILEPRKDLDWAANFAYMLGLEGSGEVFYEFIRRYVIVHSDHEGGNVTVNASRVVHSAFADLYYSYSAGINGLAGPIHGMANQSAVELAQQLLERFGGLPPEADLSAFVEDYLAQGKILPGFGHAVLRSHDPRFLILYEYGKEIGIQDDLFLVIERLANVVPPILKRIGKIKDPYPNIDLISGVMLHHFGMREFEFYPVMFALSILLGLSAQLINYRALNMPIIRPRSVTTEWLKRKAKNTPKP